MQRYDFRAIEAKWRAVWENEKTFRAAMPGEPGFDPARPKMYVLDMFPYPSAQGLHVGHPLGYIASDIVSRYKRMRGFQVLHPMGFDAFGLPAEQFAVETGTHPRVTTEKNVATYRRQLKALSFSFDWDRALATTDVAYYRWTQWIFLQLFHSWYDPAEGRARPLAEVEARLEKDAIRPGDKGEFLEPGTAAFKAAKPWKDLGPGDRSRFLGHHRLAYVAMVPVNWCPQLGTVLANEEVTNEGRSERGNYPVFKRPLEQWMLRITAYADRLAEDLSGVDWPEATKQMQLNWIGKSIGARVVFSVEGSAGTIEVFTTRPDTLFGATYMVLAPEHPLVDAVTTPAQRAAVDAYRKKAAARSELDRQAEAKDKDGVATGGFARNPVNGEKIPIWIADYVLMGYGTGAIMAVPGHDTRDIAFARQHGLPIRAVVDPPDAWFEGLSPGSSVTALRAKYLADPSAFEEVFTGEGTGIASRNDEIALDGLPSAKAKEAITSWLASKGLGRKEVQYKLRDWLFSRQRYWGEPFPILHGPDGEVVAVPENELPVELPPLEDFSPRGSDDPDAPPLPALGRADKTWKEVVRDGKVYRRELNTMPQWAGSCWYYLRYLDPANAKQMVDPAAERYWMSPGGVDLYVGGVEHAVLHLLYARFWHKVLYDLGHVSTPEPFQKLYNQGYILAYAYQDRRGIYVDAREVEERGGAFFYQGEPVTRTLGKMGKSLKNGVGPDEVLDEYGCDTLRLYEMYLGPVDASKIWDTKAIVGSHRFLQRVWRNFVDEESGALCIADRPAGEDLKRLLHRTLFEVTRNMEDLRFNTAIARLIELNNALVAEAEVPREIAEPLVLMLAPMAPHLAEELWERLGHEGGVARATWPEADSAYLTESTVEIVVQVMGRKRATLQVPAGSGQDVVERAALADPGVAKHLDGKTVRKIIHVPGKIVNIVAS